jgi:hypothetical protein
MKIFGVVIVLLFQLINLSGVVTNVNAEDDADYNYKNIAKNFQKKVSVKHKKHSHVISKVKGNFEHHANREIEVDGEGILRASSFPKKQHNSNQVLFLHFHKAGGTSICRYFKDSDTWRVPEKFCICNEKVTDHAFFAHTRKVIRMRNLDKLFEKSQADICMLEKKWLRPSYFFQIRQIFVGSFVTSLRLPWDRFRSNYEKDYSICSDQYTRNNKLKRMSIKTFSKLNPRDCLKSYYLRTNTNRPNFYVRMLNGLSIEQYAFDGSGDGGLNIMTEQHLEQAKEVLLAFDVVLFLEESPESRNLKLQKLTGKQVVHSEVSLSVFSVIRSIITFEEALAYFNVYVVSFLTITKHALLVMLQSVCWLCNIYLISLCLSL